MQTFFDLLEHSVTADI